MIACSVLEGEMVARWRQCRQCRRCYHVSILGIHFMHSRNMHQRDRHRLGMGALSRGIGKEEVLTETAFRLLTIPVLSVADLPRSFAKDSNNNELITKQSCAGGESFLCLS